jgi:hypothetical protein
MLPKTNLENQQTPKPCQHHTSHRKHASHNLATNAGWHEDRTVPGELFVKLRPIPMWKPSGYGCRNTPTPPLRSYRKEAVRLLFWATQVQNKPLSSLNREDLLAYEAFLIQPSADWIAPVLPRRGGGRRLLDGPLSASSVRQAMGILSGLFGYLVQAGYLGQPAGTTSPAWRGEEQPSCNG